MFSGINNAGKEEGYTDNEIEEIENLLSEEVSIVNGVSSIEENNSNEINIFPNPTSDLLRIDGLSEYCKITISELGGSKVLILHTFESSAELNVAEFSSGYYIVQLFYPRLGFYYQELIVKE